MGILGLVLIWPLLILLMGLVFVSASDIAGGALIFLAVIVLIAFMFGLSDKLGAAPSLQKGDSNDIDRTRRAMVSFSIALLLPILVKYLLTMTDNDLMTMILGLVLGFGVLVWGIFIKNNKVLSYANIVGGFMSILYLYFQLWTLGQLAQVIATAFGLVMAVLVSVIKFKEKLS